jgi:hypothetical protein
MIQGARQGEHEDEADTKQGMGVNGQKEIFFCYATWKRALYFLEGLCTLQKGVFYILWCFGISQRVHLLHLLSRSDFCELVCILYFCLEEPQM